MASINVNETLEEDEPFEIHHAYLRNHACGFENDLALGKHRVQDIAARLRAINGISAVLMTDRSDIDLGDFIRAALVEGINALSNDCGNLLQEADDRLRKERQAAQPKGMHHG